MKKNLYFGTIWTIVFFLYTGAVMAIAMAVGIEYLETAFFVSFALSEVCLCTLLAMFFMLGRGSTGFMDWFFGAPRIKQCAPYLGLAAIVSLLGMLLSEFVPWAVIVVLFIIPYAAFLILSSFRRATQAAVAELEEKVKDTRMFVDLLRVDAQMLYENCEDKDAREVFRQYAEMIRYSDPISDKALFELEKEVQYETMQAAEALNSGELDAALAHCKRAQSLMSERNQKCKALKGLRQTI